MRKLCLALALLVMFSSGAFATCNPDTDKFDTKGWCIDTNGQLTPKATEVNGTADGYYGGYQVPVYVNTAANTAVTILAKQSGTVFSDLGGVTSDTLSGYGSKYTLPRATVGLTYTLTVGSLSTATLDTLDTSDTFMYSISGTGLDMGDSIKSTGQAGDSVTVVCAKAGTWSIKSMKGTWTDNGTN